MMDDCQACLKDLIVHAVVQISQYPLKVGKIIQREQAVLVLFQLVSDPKNQNKGFIERAVSVDFITVFKYVLNDP